MTDMNSASGVMGGALDGVINSVRSALTGMDAQAGASAISQVQSALQGVPGTTEISSTLSDLRQQLSGGSPDASRTSQLLMQASDQTRSLSSQAGPLSGTLSQLADGLATVGGHLSSGGASRA